MKTIDLFVIGDSEKPQKWLMGDCVFSRPDPDCLSSILQDHLLKTQADAILFWDNQFSLPSEIYLNSLLESNIDVWHAGLKLGTSGKPDFINFVDPTWMLNRDPNHALEASSWRMSLRCCLIRTSVLRQMGGPLPDFISLEAAGLEMGFRYIRSGVFIRHVPGLVSELVSSSPNEIPLEDQIYFLDVSYGKKWKNWASTRAVLSNKAKIKDIIRANKKLKGKNNPKKQFKPYIRFSEDQTISSGNGCVSVLIPTVNRYPYLKVLLTQLRNQTVKPHEILIIDQTPISERDSSLQDTFSDLPIQWFYMDQAGQCSSRNLGINHASGEFILFIDDDDEISDDLIESHLLKLNELKIHVSNGVALELNSGSLPRDFTFQRISDVFPTNNTMISRDILKKSGLFDLAYDRGQRADHDLGLRLYLSGELMVLNPDITVLHHHAPMGGLREHKARVSTYNASRKGVFVHNLLTVSDLYQVLRYFNNEQFREITWINILGTFSVRGTKYKQTIKILFSFFLLPKNLWVLQRRKKIAMSMLDRYPQIPAYK